MITKVINSYDIHVNGQVLRIVDRNELRVDTPPFKTKELLLKEPRGNKYMTLVTFDDHSTRGTLDITLDGANIINNKDILLKAFVASLVERRRVETQEEYRLSLQEEEIIYRYDELDAAILYKVESRGGFYSVNDKKLKIRKTNLELEINNITLLKKEAYEQNDAMNDYLILYNDGKHIVVNRNNDIIPYPVVEVLSLLAHTKKECSTTLTGHHAGIHKDRFKFEYYLISNSQFYIDDTDIYDEGFIIK